MKRAILLSTGYLEAVAILSSWSAPAGAVEVVAQCSIDGKRLIARNASGETVGACTWKRGCSKLHVVVGFGSWQVSPVQSVDADRLDQDTETSRRFGYYHVVRPSAPLSGSSDGAQVAMELIAP